ncbi:hypothetical protein B296_00003816 [Ensete ventricosum]|uniref:Uncharacterized protein n=1 Tax=Ensete ventricosum TaxID=4639 RepID=A0A427BCD6_ENSVE|nr:hypothetical protein B296_00003816 [Ensete ventricosum]
MPSYGKSITLRQLFKHVNNAHNDDVTESNGYAFQEHHVLKLDHFVAHRGDIGNHNDNIAKSDSYASSLITLPLHESLQGPITLNDKKIKGQLLEVISAYIMQEKLLYPLLTVEETLIFFTKFWLL